MFGPECVFHFPGQSHRLFDGPLGKDAGVDKQILAFMMEHGLTAKPVQQFLYIRRLEDRLERIMFPEPRDSALNRQYMQIMVAEHDHATAFETFNEAQHFQGMGAAVD